MSSFDYENQHHSVNSANTLTIHKTWIPISLYLGWIREGLDTSILEMFTLGFTTVLMNTWWCCNMSQILQLPLTDSSGKQRKGCKICIHIWIHILYTPKCISSLYSQYNFDILTRFISEFKIVYIYRHLHK